jgi:hypothetical protein
MYKLSALSLLVLLLAVSPAPATVYIPLEELAANPALGDQPNQIFSPPRWEQTSGEKGWLAEFSPEAGFLVGLQVLDDPDSPDYGGMREGEAGGSGDLWTIIQTDNTEESIWIWSRYLELTGDSQFADNITAAWQYCQSHPAWEEEGGAGGYYRTYVSGWGLQATMKYKQVTGDSTYDGYGTGCADYLSDYILTYPPTLNLLVDIWAAGCLYNYGVFVGDESYKDSAISRAEAIKTYVESYTTMLNSETWAMSGGAIVWGLVNSYFQEHPGETASWLTTYAPDMETYVASGSWQNAWNAWYMLGHYTTWRELSDSTYYDNYDWLLNHLLAEDGDDDGGIPANEVDADDRDQSWVSNYLSYMGFDGHLHGDVPVELVRFDASATPQGVLLSWVVESDEAILGFNLYRKYDSSMDNKSSLETNKLNEYTKINSYAITGYSPYYYLDRENDCQQESEYILKAILASQEIPLGSVTLATTDKTDFCLAKISPNPANSWVRFEYSLPPGVSSASLSIFDLSGREVAELPVVCAEGRGNLTWDLRDSSGNLLQSGVYICCLRANDSKSSRELLVCR